MKRTVILTLLAVVAIIGAQAQTEKNYMLVKKSDNTMLKMPIDEINGFSFVNQKTFTVNGVEFRMIKVVGGTFQMGKGSDGWADRGPVHNVTLSDYYIGETEVTQELWQAVMGSNPSNFKGAKLPVETVSWEDCQTFIVRMMSLTGHTFRLPTEAEWEFAAKGGNLSEDYAYSGSNQVTDVAWYLNNSQDKTHDVATKAPNELGLYDMSGNVFEYCQDWSAVYSSEDQTNPTGPSSGTERVRRGGSWRQTSACVCNVRNSISPSSKANDRGFRLALTP